jgi:hypothetical protein
MGFVFVQGLMIISYLHTLLGFAHTTTVHGYGATEENLLRNAGIYILEVTVRLCTTIHPNQPTMQA